MHVIKQVAMLSLVFLFLLVMYGSPVALADPNPVCTETYTPIYDIQGSGTSAAITGTITTQGIVVGDYEGPSPCIEGFLHSGPLGG